MTWQKIDRILKQSKNLTLRPQSYKVYVAISSKNKHYQLNIGTVSSDGLIIQSKIPQATG